MKMILYKNNNQVSLLLWAMVCTLWAHKLWLWDITMGYRPIKLIVAMVYRRRNRNNKLLKLKKVKFRQQVGVIWLQRLRNNANLTIWVELPRWKHKLNFISFILNVCVRSLDNKCLFTPLKTMRVYKTKFKEKKASLLRKQSTPLQLLD